MTITSNMQSVDNACNAAAFRRDYFDAATAEIGDYVPYGSLDDDSMAWGDSINALRARGLYLHDTGDGYRIEQIED